MALFPGRWFTSGVSVADSATWLFERLAGFGERCCLIHDDRQTTYAAFAGRVQNYREQLAARPPETVILRGDYDPESVALLLAYAGTHHCVAPFLADATEPLTGYARACGAETVARIVDRVLVFEPSGVSVETPPLLRKLRERRRSGLILFSSGSTGTPKAMVHDFADFLGQYIDRKPKRLRILLFLLFDHIGGLNTLFGSLASGMCLVAPLSRNPDMVASLVATHGVDVLPTTPTFLNLLLLGGDAVREQLAGLRVITYGAERMPGGLLARVREAFPRAKLIQTFGTSETGIRKTATASGDDTALRLGVDGTDYRIVDGELWLRSSSQVLGYLNADNNRFEPDGWFRTGDEAEALPDGSVRILTRARERINVGGEKVYPAEVETVLLELPEVGACSVFGVPNAITGSTVAAEVVPASPCAADSAAALRSRIRSHARQRLARHKVPTKILITDQLNVTGRFKRANPGS